MLQTSFGKYIKLSFDVTSLFFPLEAYPSWFLVLQKNQHQVYEKYAASDLLEIYKVSESYIKKVCHKKEAMGRQRRWNQAVLLIVLVGDKA